MPAPTTETSTAGTPAPPASANPFAALGSDPSGRLARLGTAAWPWRLGALLGVLALAALVAAAVPVGPDWWADAGAVTISTLSAAALAARVGGRPLRLGGLALVLGALTLVLDTDPLRAGAAVLTCAAAAMLGVVVTVPAATYGAAVREALLAVLVAAAGGLAALGYAPGVDLTRFEYASFGIALLGVLGVVYRLGAGFHGLGRRGQAIALVGALGVLGTALYGELLRRYGTPGLVDQLTDVVAWSRDTLGAFPRPIATLLGVPALIWGVHMRARRRQGWWLCAFGVTATAAAANGLANPATDYTEAALVVAYGLLLGAVVAYLLVRGDQMVTGGGSSRGRRSRVAERSTAVRPEPRRTATLL
ncbi:hypothetical protein [Nocardioides sp.]|uniref:hypothetical protein n=1 Tax=Nocardioides sp. TaxID=35761 RepID=UPI0035155A05